jgi:hypothetical protein
LNKPLRLELATMNSPPYPDSASRALGLKAAAPEQIVVLP